MKTIYRFEPAWWLNSPHLQTIWPEVMRRPIKLTLEVVRFELLCGDFVDLVWTNRGCSSTVIVLHGLGGSIESSYVRGMLSALGKRNFNTVAMHFRGCSKNLNRHPQMFHAGHTADLKEVILDLKRREPDSKLYAVGFSVGGNILLKYLGEEKEGALLSGAVAISTPFLLDKTQEALSNGFSNVYQQYLLARLKLTAIKKFMRHNYEQISLLSVLATRNLRHFDEIVTTPLHGFKNVDEYYSHASSHAYLKEISVPTLIVHAKDDPFFPGRALPKASDISSSIKLLITNHGGHVGFVSGDSPRNPVYWLEQVVPHYLKKIEREQRMGTHGH